MLAEYALTEHHDYTRADVRISRAVAAEPIVEHFDMNFHIVAVRI